MRILSVGIVRASHDSCNNALSRGHVLGPIIRRSGAIPVYRRIDAGVDPARNVEAFAAVEAVLARGEVVCVFPEGISHSTGRLEPLRTGAARMTLASLARGTRVTLIPIGLNFHRLVSFRSRATVAYGVPFDCADLAAAYREAPGDAVQALTERIGRHLRELLVEADPRTELRIIDRVERLYSAASRIANNSMRSWFVASRATPVSPSTTWASAAFRHASWNR